MNLYNNIFRRYLWRKKILDSAKFCNYCETKTEAYNNALKVISSFIIEHRGFFIKGIPETNFQKNDTLKNVRTGKTYSVCYIATEKGKLLKTTKLGEICLVNLVNANSLDFNAGDILTK